MLVFVFLLNLHIQSSFCLPLGLFVNNVSYSKSKLINTVDTYIRFYTARRKHRDLVVYVHMYNELQQYTYEIILNCLPACG